MQAVRVWVKRLLSYSKPTWNLEDYPVRYRRRDVVGAMWFVQIVNWWQLAGAGDTKREAFAKLREGFESYRRGHDSLPRPGSGAAVEFASQETVRQYGAVARDYLDRMFSLDLDRCFISDDSSLWDFARDDSIDEFLRRTEELYGVDVADVEGAKLGLIFQRIDSHRLSG